MPKHGFSLLKMIIVRREMQCLTVRVPILLLSVAILQVQNARLYHLSDLFFGGEDVGSKKAKLAWCGIARLDGR